MLAARKRLSLAVPFESWLIQAAAPDVVRVLPIEVAVILALHRLPERFRGDPADRIIAATALAHDLAVATRDANLRRSRLFRLWKR